VRIFMLEVIRPGLIYIYVDELSILFTGAPAPPESYVLKSSEDCDRSPLIVEDDDDDDEDRSESPTAHIPSHPHAPFIDTDVDTDYSSQSLLVPDPDPITPAPTWRLTSSGSSTSTPPLPPVRTLSTLPNIDPLFKTIQLGTDRRLLINRKRKLKMYRVWVQGNFEKL